MSNEYVQSNYEELEQVAQRFARQAELTEQLWQRLKQKSETLRNSWAGSAADAFSREMGIVLLPGVKRLQQAQVQAHRTVKSIQQTMNQAESEAAALFRAAPDGGMGSGGGGFGGAFAQAAMSSVGGAGSTFAEGAATGGAVNTVNAAFGTGAKDSANGSTVPTGAGGSAMEGMGGGGLANGIGDSPVTESKGGVTVENGGASGRPAEGMGGGGLDNGSGGMQALSSAQTGTAALTFGKNANQAGVSTHSRDVLNDILSNSKNSSATITSTARTVQDQARIMYGNIESQGVAKQKQLYGPNGDKVIDVYVKGKAAGKSQMEIRSLMVAKINELGPTNVSKHLADPAVMNVVDISPASIKNRAAFEAAVRADPRVSKFLTPGDGDPAYHIEIPQPKKSSGQ